MRNRILLLSIVIVLALIAFYLIYRGIDPLSAVWMPKCYFKSWSGLSCPGCGTQRAIHSLFNGDFRAAFCHNPLLVLSVPYVILIFLFEIKSVRDRFPRFRDLLLGQRSIWVLLAILGIYTIVRNIFGF